MSDARINRPWGRWILAAFLVLLPVIAQAFGSINSLGQSAEHEKITRLALGPEGFEPKSLDEIAGKTGTFGAVGAPDRPDRGLLSRKAAHCDGGDFLDIPGYPHAKSAAEAALSDCRQWIADHLDAAVRGAGALLNADGGVRDSEMPTHLPCVYNGRPGRAKCNVLEDLGLAFHAAQDFYAHSNWTDRPVRAVALDNPPGLGNDRPAPWLDPRRGSRFPNGLISGCYDGFPERLYCENRVRHRDLNKDTGPIDLASGMAGAGSTPRSEGNDNFARAVRAAIADTRDKWAYFEERVVATYGRERGARIVCAVVSDNPVRSCQ
jgi:hypothetical protein